jgi:hypothetical protein
MNIDFHTHSTASDGMLAPAELVTRAHTGGVEMLALTDHDTVAGLQAAAAAASALGLRFVNGIELSATWQKKLLHVVGLNIDPASPPLQEGIDRLQAARAERARRIGDRLAKLGFPGAYDGARAIAGETTPGRVHFARHLVNCGGMKTEQDAFKRLLGAGKPACVAIPWAPLHEAVDWVVASGGVAVLAHPLRYRLTASWLRRICATFREAGGRGIEVLSGWQNPEQTASVIRLAKQHGFYASVGSDFHAPGQPSSELGRLRMPQGDIETVTALFH